MEMLLYDNPLYKQPQLPLPLQKQTTKHSEMMKATGAAKPVSYALLVVLVLVVAKINPAAGQDPPCNTTFFSSLVQLMPCRPAVAPFSPSPPSESCCNAIRSLGQPCLCAIINGPPIAGIDRSMALQLPSKCSIESQPCGTTA